MRNPTYPLFQESDNVWMKRAMELAKRAADQGEVPVGAVLVSEKQIIGEGFNCSIGQHDPTAHAEIVAMRNASKALGNYRLPNTTLYVTLEPCIMCAGAMIHARIGRLIHGALDPKAGAIESRTRILDNPFLNHRIQYSGGLFSKECGEILSQFFRARR